MKQLISIIGYGLVTLVLVDVMVVIFTMLQIGNGGYTPHIGFWDEQVRIVATLLK